MDHLEQRDELRSKPATAADYLAAICGSPGQQILCALFYGHARKYLGFAEIFREEAEEGGWADSETILHEALGCDAVAICVYHLFPAIKTRIAEEDKRLGRQLVEASEKVGLNVIECLLISGGDWVCLRGGEAVKSASEIPDRASRAFRRFKSW